jgi:GntR family transcriptional regulator
MEVTSTKSGIEPRGERDALPRYRWIREQILKHLAESKLRRGDAIQSEVQIAKQFGVSLGTVRKAVDELVAQQILERRQGRGTFVATRDLEASTLFLFHIVAENDVKELPAFERLISSRTRQANEYEARRLKLARDLKVVEVRRTRRFSDRTVMCERLILPEGLFPDFQGRLGRQRPVMLYDFYEKAFGVSVMNFEERVRAVNATTAQSRVIGCAPGAAVLEIERTSYSYSDVPVELRISLCETRRHYYLHPRRSVST